jgi:hypothetical protein
LVDHNRESTVKRQGNKSGYDYRHFLVLIDGGGGPHSNSSLHTLSHPFTHLNNKILAFSQRACLDFGAIRVFFYYYLKNLFLKNFK